MNKLLGLLLLATGLPLFAQSESHGMTAVSGTTHDFSLSAITKPFTTVSSDPTGSCSNASAWDYSTASGNLFVCISGTWNSYAPGAGGSVTSVGCGFGLTGGTITATGTCAVNTAVVPSSQIVENNDLGFVNSTTGNTSYAGCPAGFSTSTLKAGMNFRLTVDTASATTATLWLCNIGSTLSLTLNDGTTAVGTKVKAGVPYWVFYDGSVWRLDASSTIDFPERVQIPAANCNNTTSVSGWSIGSGGTVACRAGTNNLGGYISITDTSSTFAQFQLSIPADWDTATNPYILFGLISKTDTTSGHTVIPQIKISCPTATNGTVTDDHAFAAAHSAATITLGGSAVANGFYTTSVQMNSTDMTGCVGGGMMIVQVGRATDTATGTIGFEYADLTFPRILTVQAN